MVLFGVSNIWLAYQSSIHSTSRLYKSRHTRFDLTSTTDYAGSMPGVLLRNMSSPLSSPTASTEGDSNNRRRSGRVVKKPDFLAPEASATSKRKRATANEEVEDDEDAEDESEEEDVEEAEPAEEEVRATKARRPKNVPKRPAAKKPKTNGTVAHLPIRGTTTKARPRKKKAQAPDTADAEEAGGLYTEVFARNHALEDVVTEWIRHFHDGESEAVADLINFVLKCSGCDLKVTKHDIEDVDGVTAKLADLQEEFQAVSDTAPII